MNNQKIADVLYEIANLLDIRGDNFFKTRAYRMAAQKIEVLNENIIDLVKEKRLSDIEGIGKALTEKISELALTGKLKYLEDLKSEIPESLLEMLKISSLGPKKVSALYNELDIKTIDELKDACKKGIVRDLEGFGEITEKKILRGIKMREKTSGRVFINIASEDADEYISYLKSYKNIIRLSIAGSLRRRKETIGDLDILVSSNNPDEVMDYFVKYDRVKSVLMKGSTKTSVILDDNVQVDLRVVEDKSFGSALQYFTGSKEHNVKMRSIAIKKGFKLNEYGLFDKKTEKIIIGKEEADIYKKLGLSYIEPELRENHSEVDSASKNLLPNLITQSDIKGDLHVHSNYSDGSEKIEDMVKVAVEMGYEYIGFADHSQSLRVANGLNFNRVKKKKSEIDKIQKKYPQIKIFCSTECDILKDGSLDYDDKILEFFDYVVIGIHTKFLMDKKEITNRIIKGMENKYSSILAHPTCRIIGYREPFDLDIEKILDSAKDTGTYMEINSFPDRLDLNDLHSKMAKDRGVKIAINTDAHQLDQLSYIKYGISNARRGWLEKNDVLNTKNLKEINKIFGL